MQIANSKTREKYPLSIKKALKKTLVGTFVLNLLLLIAWIVVVGYLLLVNADAESFITISTIGVFSFIFLVVLLTYLYQRWYYAVYFYDLTDDFVVIKKGPITPTEITIPYERVQDVYMDQDLLDRFFGLYDVHLSSATASSGMEAHIDGVERPAADGLKQTLLETVRTKISKK